MSHLKKFIRRMNVIGPLLKLCMLVEKAHRSREKVIPIDSDDIRTYIGKQFSYWARPVTI